VKDKRNRAVIEHKGKTFIIYQEEKDNWCYTFDTLVDVNSQTKDLQTALNMVRETIDDRIASEQRATKKATELGNWKVSTPFPFVKKASQYREKR